MRELIYMAGSIHSLMDWVLLCLLGPALCFGGLSIARSLWINACESAETSVFDLPERTNSIRGTSLATGTAKAADRGVKAAS